MYLSFRIASYISTLLITPTVANSEDIAVHLNTNVARCFDEYNLQTSSKISNSSWSIRNDFNPIFYFDDDSNNFEDIRYAKICDRYYSEKVLSNESQYNESIWRYKYEVDAIISLILASKAAHMEKMDIASAFYIGPITDYIRLDGHSDASIPHVLPLSYILGMSINGFEITRPFVLREREPYEDSMTQQFNEAKEKALAAMSDSG